MDLNWLGQNCMIMYTGNSKLPNLTLTYVFSSQEMHWIIMCSIEQ